MSKHEFWCDYVTNGKCNCEQGDTMLIEQLRHLTGGRLNDEELDDLVGFFCITQKGKA